MIFGRKRSTKYKIYVSAKVMFAIGFIIYVGTPAALLDFFMIFKDAFEVTLQK